MELYSSYYEILVGMGKQWLGYEIGIGDKVGKNTFVVTVKVHCLEYGEASTLNYRDQVNVVCNKTCHIY
jgi:hypothetical protein